MYVGILGKASINSTKTIVRTATEAETNKRLGYRIMGDNRLMHRVEFFDLVPVTPEPDKPDSALSGVATRVTKGTDLAYPSLIRDYRSLIQLAPVVWPFVLMNMMCMLSIALGILMEHRGKLGRIKKILEGWVKDDSERCARAGTGD